VACLFPTRSQAKAACEGGKVDVAGERAKPHREIRAGDRIGVSGRGGTRRELVVRGLAERSIPKAEARRLDRMLAPRGSTGRPDKRERRERRKLKGW